MKAEELMIGDWINLQNGIRLQPRRVTGFNIEGSIYLDFGYEPHMNITTVDKINPIPLTPEILEKNGFKSWKYGYMWKERIGIGGQTTSASSPIEIIIYEGGHSVIINPHDGKDFQGSIDNVHELQHALKLCGIHKEIVIHE